MWPTAWPPPAPITPIGQLITAPWPPADPREDLLDALHALRTGQPHPQLTRHHYLAHLRGKTVFVLPGQGAQYPGMGRRALRTPPRLRRHWSMTVIKRCARSRVGRCARSCCRDPAAPSLDRVDVVQPVLFTMMVSLAEVLSRYGIVPDAVIGHSQGEIAAAYIAGVLSLPEAAEVVALRSQALSALSWCRRYGVGPAGRRPAAARACNPGVTR